jgi:1-acyl-sn-glycerol-3-phosphate acyltransferase
MTAIYAIRSGLAIALFVILMLAMYPIVILANVLTLGYATNPLTQYILPWFMAPCFWVLGIRFKRHVHEQELPKQAIYIFNHNATLDLLTIFALGIPRSRYVAKWEIQYIPVLFLLGRVSGQIFIKRQNSKQAVQHLHKQYKRILKQRLSIVIAPEGTRKHKGLVGPFKKGPFRMAIDLGIPIVPIFFEGNRDRNPGDSLVVTPGKVRAHIMPAIDTSNWSTSTLPKHIEDVRNLYIGWEESSPQHSVA